MEGEEECQHPAAGSWGSQASRAGGRKTGGTRRGTDESSRDLGSFEKQICNPSHCTCLKGSALLKA